MIAHGTMVAFGARCRGETTDPIDGWRIDHVVDGLGAISAHPITTTGSRTAPPRQGGGHGTPTDRSPWDIAETGDQRAHAKPQVSAVR